jgi:hypothetical protein
MGLSEGRMTESQNDSSYNKRQFDEKIYDEYEEKILNYDSIEQSLAKSLKFRMSAELGSNFSCKGGAAPCLKYEPYLDQ